VLLACVSLVILVWADPAHAAQVACPATAALDRAPRPNALNSIVAVVGIPWKATASFCISPGDTLGQPTFSWGDGTQTPAAVTYSATAPRPDPDSGGGVPSQPADVAILTAAHVFTTPNLAGIPVRATAIDQPSATTLSILAGVSQVLPRDAVDALTIRTGHGATFGGIVARVTAPNAANAHVPDDRLAATVDWGPHDQSAGELAETGDGYVIRAGHRWHTAGRHRFVVTLVDSIGPQSVQAVGEAVVGR